MGQINIVLKRFIYFLIKNQSKNHLRLLVKSLTFVSHKNFIDIKICVIFVV